MIHDKRNNNIISGEIINKFSNNICIEEEKDYISEKFYIDKGYEYELIDGFTVEEIEWFNYEGY